MTSTMLEYTAVPSLRHEGERSPRKQITTPAQTLHEKILRLVNILRFLLPALLVIVANGFELYEHWNQILLYDIQLLGEILIFGVLGPVLVFVWLSYIGVLIKKLAFVNGELAKANMSLEKQVAERTAMLALRNQELANANAELASKNQELHQLDQLKSDFVSLVSHELRTPLTTLNGAIEMTLQAHCTLPEQPRQLLEVMATESRRLTSFVQTILDLSQLEAGKIRFNPGMVAVKPLLMRSVAATLGHTNRPVVWRTASRTPPVWADEIHVEQIVRNILTNADKYTPSGSPVEIAVNQVSDGIQIDIIDHGPGIPASAQPRIFERFHRQPGVDGGVTPGWGLGLYFARALTEAQGGRLTVASPVHADAEHPGTRFSILLPLAEAPAVEG